MSSTNSRTTNSANSARGCALAQLLPNLVYTISPLYPSRLLIVQVLSPTPDSLASPPASSTTVHRLPLAVPDHFAMEVFVHNLPRNRSRRKVQGAIRNAVRGALCGRIAYEWVHFTRDRALGTITFPEVYMAQELLNKYGNGLHMLGRSVKFAPSRRPLDARVVEGLRRRMEEKADESESDNEPVEDDRGITLEEMQLSVYKQPQLFDADVHHSLVFMSLEYGVWKSDGTFGRCGKLERGGGYIKYNRDTARLNVEGLMADRGSSSAYMEAGISIENGIIEEILVDRTGKDARLFLTLSRIPRFWSEDKRKDRKPAEATRPTNPQSPQIDSVEDLIGFMDALTASDIDSVLDDLVPLFDSNEEPPRYRLSALCAEHAPYAPFSTVYVFNLAGKVDPLLRRLFRPMNRSGYVDTFVRISSVDFDFIGEFRQLLNRFSRYDYRIAFQLESFVRNCILLPGDVVSLESRIDALIQDRGLNHSVRILQQFSSSLPLRLYDSLSGGSNFEGLFDEVTRIGLGRGPRADPNAVWIHRFDLTPAAFNMEGPILMGSNRFLRKYPGHQDHFLKVSFVEEDLTTVRYDRDFDLSSIIRNRWRPIFSHQSSDPVLASDPFFYWNPSHEDTPSWIKPSLRVAGRDFEFLGFSSSSLKEHSVWFIARFEYQGKMVNGDSLRSELGDFHEIRCPPRYAARLGQTFTVTSHSLDITSDDEVESIPDVSIRDNSDPLGNKKLDFSDGVGTMSQSMLDRIWEATIPKHSTDIKPVVYQIRCGGAKGVLSLDPTLRGRKVCLRPSMKKFKAEPLTLELANKARPLPFFLNRQIIVLLETLGLARDNFLKLLRIEVNKLEIASRNFEEARNLCQRYNLGQTSRFPKILKTLQQWNVANIFEMPFFRRLLWLALIFALKQIKYRARIAVDESWTLMGVMDEFNHLNEGEVYVCLKHEVDGTPRYLAGKTLITRMPALHCGDVQYVHAIGSVDSGNPLSALHNCIVFSSCGRRPIPNMLSGGDLDGDLYQISQNPLLFPPVTDEPDSYPSVKPKELDRDCTMADIADFFVYFIVNDRVGQICNMHLILADLSDNGARNPKCITLSRLAAQATDFPKTGHAVDMESAPRMPTRLKPDFMAERSLRDEDFDGRQNYQQRDNNLYYPSQKVLGEMYRSVHIRKLLVDWKVDTGGNEDGPMKLWKDIEPKLRKVRPPYQTDWATYVSAAKSTFEQYVSELKIIARRFHPKPWRDESLKEEEVFLQCIEMDMSKKKLRGRGRYDFMHGMRMEYGDVVESVLENSWPERERFLWYCACFFIGITAPQKRRDKLGESFAWLVIPELFESYQKLEKNNFEEEVVDSADYEGFHPYDQNALFPKEDGVDDTLRETMRNFGVMRI